MKKTTLIIITLIGFGLTSYGQFHTMKIPHPSNHVEETQTLAVTDITIDYSSPSTNGRDVWNDTNVIPQNGNPIAWRAGANMATKITFSTDVKIEGQDLAAGTYGFHVIPKGSSYQLIFSHVPEQWGSYYLDLENDVTLSVEVGSEESPFSEKLDYEFLNWEESKVTIGLEWGDRRIPFEVSVDLNKTVLESFRSELRGLNTYRWQAWNDAANWCLRHDTNLEEALTWAERSINGGYGGFSANSNGTNNATRIRLLHKLGRTQDLQSAVSSVSEANLSANDINYVSQALVDLDLFAEGDKLLEKALKTHSQVWYLHLNKAITSYFTDNNKAALKSLDKCMDLAPEQFATRLNEIKESMANKTYQIPGR